MENTRFSDTTYFFHLLPHVFVATGLTKHCIKIAVHRSTLPLQKSQTNCTNILKVSDKRHKNKNQPQLGFTFHQIPGCFVKNEATTTLPAPPPALFYHPSTYLPGAWSPVCVCVSASQEPAAPRFTPAGGPPSAPRRKVLSGAEGRAPGLPPAWGG